MKSNLYNIGTAFVIMLGIAMSFNSTEKADAQELKASNSLRQQSGIPCWSSGTSPWISFRRYVECASCASIKGRPTGGAGNCGGGVSEISAK